MYAAARYNVCGLKYKKNEGLYFLFSTSMDIYLYGRVVSKTYLLQKYIGITIISIYRQALGKRKGYSGGSVLHSGPLMRLS